jgi:hypothetical protein
MCKALGLISSTEKKERKKNKVTEQVSVFKLARLLNS